MANEPISAFTAASALDGTEELGGVQSAANVKVTPAQIKTFVEASPTLVTPVLGVASVTSINKVAITAPAASATLTIANTKTLSYGGDSTGSTTAVGLGTNSPAISGAAPYTWLEFTSGDGSTVYVPAYK